ncbi:MAG TPA: hypothetical protein VMW36_07885 [Patescibacteria group bacterium]|nr:hypothetical protein [Patescibacteria group bacterium]
MAGIEACRSRNMVSKSVEIVLKTLKSNPNLMKDLNDTWQKIFDKAKVDLSDEDTAELFRTMTESIIIVDKRKNMVIIEAKSTMKQSYQEAMEKGRKEGSLNFEMWLRHVKNLTGQTIFQMNFNPDPVIQGKLREEYEKWKGKK